MSPVDGRRGAARDSSLRAAAPMEAVRPEVAEAVRPASARARPPWGGKAAWPEAVGV
ncbi:hypothetical protein GCM10009530_27880 [Microbispora corallina]|uniref:Uncharacterized protein n=1 Tax=Microbispora corallina TaxID=83302 RepID=A0ABQ4FZK9_9ACTN|nr:hypothetical protein [Microbispora corallina]GIH40173.1 hypothetical protein Mco01_31730 [Microbispora corallina]